MTFAGEISYFSRYVLPGRKSAAVVRILYMYRLIFRKPRTLFVDIPIFGVVVRMRTSASRAECAKKKIKLGWKWKKIAFFYSVERACIRYIHA